MIILSLFDGMSCGRVALERAGIPVTKYYASEIDKYAIQVSKKNYPDIVQLGDINNFDSDKGRFVSGIPYSDPGVGLVFNTPDLIIGGSPCQGFSFAGKQLAFDDPRSALFWKYVEIVKYYKPKYFLLENVRMKKEHLRVITDALGVEPICINSALVSAQNRVRYYWTNIPNVTQPKDKGIVLKDIIEHGVCDRDKSFCIDANYWKGGDLKQYFEKHRRQLIFNHCDQNGTLDLKGHERDNRVYTDLGKSPTILAHTGGNKHIKVLQVNPDKSAGGKQPHMQDRVYHEEGKSVAVTSSFGNRINVLHTSERGRRLNPEGTHRDDVTEDYIIRKLTPIECERLQTLPDNYTEGVSNTQRYKMLGNGWTIDVIAHLFKGLKL